jgi:hypothetical protein
MIDGWYYQSVNKQRKRQELLQISFIQIKELSLWPRPAQFIGKKTTQPSQSQIQDHLGRMDTRKVFMAILKTSLGRQIDSIIQESLLLLSTNRSITTTTTESTRLLKCHPHLMQNLSQKTIAMFWVLDTGCFCPQK